MGIEPVTTGCLETNYTTEPNIHDVPGRRSERMLGRVDSSPHFGKKIVFESADKDFLGREIPFKNQIKYPFFQIRRFLALFLRKMPGF